MDVLITCKYEEDPIKNEGARVVTTLYINISDAQGQITLVLVLEDPINNEGARVVTTFFWELSVAMDTRVLIRSGPTPNASFPPTQ